jgi:gentisate 1,2-dioxygenase
MHEMTKPAIDFDAAQDLPALHRLLDQVQMKNGWAKPTPSLYPLPKQSFIPAHFQFAIARPALHAAGRLVGTDKAERRNLIMANPIPGNDYPTVSTLVGAYQMVKAGESARSHRHTPNAMRIILEGAPNAYTIVDGKRIPMLDGDVLLTPNWCYHGHDNQSDHDAYWIDFLDVPMVHFLGPMFFETHPEMLEPSDEIDEKSAMRFAYAEYRPALLAAAEIARGVKTLTLGPAQLTTFDRVAVHLDAGTTWDCPRSTTNHIFVALEGSGVSTVNGSVFSWQRGDIVAVPSWYEHSHVASTDALLMRVSDAPLMRMLGWDRTEVRQF